LCGVSSSSWIQVLCSYDDESRLSCMMEAPKPEDLQRAYRKAALRAAGIQDRGPADDPSGPFCTPFYRRDLYRFKAAWTCLLQKSLGCYCCVQGTEGQVGTSISPCCMPFVCYCGDSASCFGSNPCCLCATWAHTSIDQYLAIQLAR
jgi:hypothetical protein